MIIWNKKIYIRLQNMGREFPESLPIRLTEVWDLLNVFEERWEGWIHMRLLYNPISLLQVVLSLKIPSTHSSPWSLLSSFFIPSLLLFFSPFYCFFFSTIQPSPCQTYFHSQNLLSFTFISDFLISPDSSKILTTSNLIIIYPFQFH